MARFVALAVVVVSLGLPFALVDRDRLANSTSSDARPLTDSDRYAWVDPTPDPHRPESCGNCHREIHDEWAGGAHAKSASNPRFLAAYQEVRRHNPDGIDVCASCHSPTLKPGPFGELDIRAALDGPPELSGVHCDFCHKVVGPGDGEFGLTHGRFQLVLMRPAPESGRQLIFGPLPDPVRRENFFSPFQRDSRLCAACHEGTVFGVPVYTTYSEWQESPAGKQGVGCQGCHMTPTGAMSNMAPGHGGRQREPATLGNHRFFDRGQAEMLRECLKLEAEVKKGMAEVRLTATNVGHRVPTGFIDRHLVLTVEAFAGKRAVPIYHGPRLPEHFGPSPPGTFGKVYAKVLADGQGNRPAAFWNADPQTISDTRLKPGETDRSSYRFADEADRVRVRIVHRKAWNVADELLIAERDFYLNPPADNR